MNAAFISYVYIVYEKMNAAFISYVYIVQEWSK